jgi:hypothetical protein
MNDPLGIDENTRPNTEFFVLEVADHDGCRVVGMMSLLHASEAPFMFERVFPEAWQGKTGGRPAQAGADEVDEGRRGARDGGDGR